jgi:release factor glutamine methyltransferase
MTFGDYKSKVVTSLSIYYGADEALAIACMVIEKLTGKPRAMQYQTTQMPVPPEKIPLLNTYQQELEKGRPVQYVLGEAWFLGRKFLVNESVLIPRPETEELVLLAIEIITKKGLPTKDLKILDIGTGSGCIAISLALELNGTMVTGLDISSAALEVAAQNSQKLFIQVNWQDADFLNPETWDAFASCEVIVSNPPYIPLTEKSILDKNVTEWEPSLALFTPDEDPFVFYKAIATFCKKYPIMERILVLEGHQSYMAALQHIFSGIFKHVNIKKDIHDNERMLLCCN